jgi:hypothetical protein
VGTFFEGQNHQQALAVDISLGEEYLATLPVVAEPVVPPDAAATAVTGLE